MIVYRLGAAYRIAARGPDWQRVVLALADGVSVKKSGMGDVLAYGPHAVYGMPISYALREGWCQIQEQPGDELLPECAAVAVWRARRRPTRGRGDRR
jgi:hypothetical protein